ncbi:MAG TPA: response regulator [Terriglobia bacterium]|nr:response regulator [Terriglobia bacterium]
MSETAVIENLQSPTVFFIDDSATMREVMKIAFRRENIGVVACHDANDALLQIEESMPDVVITDVIMPDKDGFEVCEFIKQHPLLNKIPVVLLSGVVNREVADKAFNVKADELIRKPFQPQDLIARVKQLLSSKNPAPASTPPGFAASATPAPSNGGTQRGAALSGIFASAPLPARTPAARVPSPHVAPPPTAAVPAALPAPLPPTPVPTAPRNPFATAGAPPQARNLSVDMAKLRLEVGRLENLVKKLQSELVAEREYSRALEAHVKTLQEND